jgi:predicted nucleic acid-binding Zn ribbon protein
MGKYTKTPKQEKPCRNCGKAFLAFSQSSYACSKICRDICISKERKEQRKPFVKTLSEFECIFCKTLFTQKYTWQKFCSVLCQTRDRNSRKEKAQQPLIDGKPRRPTYGKPQTQEHVEKRIKSLADSLSKQKRNCVVCENEYTPTKAAQKYCSGSCWQSANRKPRENRIYLPAAEYQAMMEKQDGKCAICNSEGGYQNRPGKLAVDHCHISGKIRGLLCHRCNTAIGLLKDNIENLNSAIRYLETH